MDERPRNASVHGMGVHPLTSVRPTQHGNLHPHAPRCRLRYLWGHTGQRAAVAAITWLQRTQGLEGKGSRLDGDMDRVVSSVSIPASYHQWGQERPKNTGEHVLREGGRGEGGDEQPSRFSTRLPGGLLIDSVRSPNIHHRETGLGYLGQASHHCHSRPRNQTLHFTTRQDSPDSSITPLQSHPGHVYRSLQHTPATTTPA